nr:polysaccharide deacetylase family protein [Sulfobacillus harzensis]
MVWFGPKTNNAVYITIDDGWFPSQRVLQLMQRTHLPVTAFLIKDAVQEHLSYWKAFVAAGGIIEDHTVSHPPLTSVSPAEMYYQWHTPIVDYKSWFGATPTLGRPPYGAVNSEVMKEAQAAGLQHLIMWSAVVDAKGMQTWNNGPLQPGDIILLHWDPGLYTELSKLLAVIHADHLTPESLPQALS